MRWPRRTTATREGSSPPERGIINRPELLRAMSRRLGIRGSHVLPVLSDTVQAVILLDDVAAAERRTSFPRRVSWAIRGGSPGGAFVAAVALWNPPDSGVLARVHRVTVSHDTRLLAGGAARPARIGWCAHARASGAGLGIKGTNQNQDLSKLFPVDSSPVSSYEVDLAVAGVLTFRNIGIESFVVHDWEPLDLLVPPGFSLETFTEESVDPFTNEMWVTYEWEEEKLVAGS